MPNAKVRTILSQSCGKNFSHFALVLSFPCWLNYWKACRAVQDPQYLLRS
jgi:hypothetical protein